MDFSESDKTAEFYDQNAAGYFEETACLDVGHLRKKFVDYLPGGGKVLDAGCGSGRDSLAFQQLGYQVVAVDASKGMAAVARERFGIDVEVLRLQEISFDSEFDGVWASASLLHLAKSELPGAMRRLTRALKVRGVLYGSFKEGTGEEWREGRFFCHLTESDCLKLVEDTPRLELTEFWTSSDVRADGNSGNGWLNFCAKKF